MSSNFCHRPTLLLVLFSSQARTEALQLRAEREAALNRLRQQLEASQRSERESVKQLVSSCRLA